MCLLETNVGRRTWESAFSQGVRPVKVGSGRWVEHGPASMGNLRETGSVSHWENMLQSSRPRYMQSWHVFMEFKQTLDQRNALVFVLTARELWKLLGLPKQHPHWCNSAKRRWTFPTTILWGCFGSPDILGVVEMKLPKSSQGRELFTSLLDRSLPWGSLDTIQEDTALVGQPAYGNGSKTDLGP